MNEKKQITVVLGGMGGQRQIEKSVFSWLSGFIGSFLPVTPFPPSISYATHGVSTVYDSVLGLLLSMYRHKEVLLSIYSYWIVVFPKKIGYTKRSSNTSDVVHPKSKQKF